MNLNCKIKQAAEKYSKCTPKKMLKNVGLIILLGEAVGEEVLHTLCTPVKELLKSDQPNLR